MSALLVLVADESGFRPQGFANSFDSLLSVRMEQYTPTLLNWSLALGAYAIGGALWAAVVFLGVAVVRLSLEVQRLRRKNAELADEQRQSPRACFVDTGFREAPPTRAVTSSMARPPMTFQS
ncbi:MAG TPA: hypothetical protein VHU80_25355 [Polyangiaceae bacterium]|nr:hypothetical protein [Polyangiaceae bacterium]